METQPARFKITGVEKKVASNGAIFFNLKDENNKNYKIWKSIKDGSDSVAYKDLIKLPDEGLGKIVDAMIEFQQGDFNGKPVTYRTVRSMGLASETPLVKPTQEAVKQVQNDQVMKELNEIKAMLNLLVADKQFSEPTITVLDEEEIKVDDLMQ